MNTGLPLDLLLIVMVFALLLSGYPAALVLAGVGLLFAGIGFVFGQFDLSLLAALAPRLFGIMTNQVLIAVPLFIFMGVTLERSKVGEELLETFAQLFSRVSGGLGLSVMFVGMLLAASTGIVGATVVTMGLLSLPAMLHAGYSPRLASGVIAASGTLGQIIPPSIVLIVLADQISNAWQKAQFEQGAFSPDTVSVGDLFAGALVPGLLLVLLYMIYLYANAKFGPVGAKQGEAVAPLSTRRLLWALVPPLVLIIAVLGSILAGIATPTEAASLGAVGSILLGAARLTQHMNRICLVSGLALFLLFLLAGVVDLRVARETISPVEWVAIVLAAGLLVVAAWGLGVALVTLYRQKILSDILNSAASITTMIFTILIGASVFSLVFRGLGGDDSIRALLTSLPGGTLGALLVTMALMFVLGFFLDFLEIVFVVVPLMAPVLLQLPMANGDMMNPVWLGVLLAVILQTSFLTPPFGVALFYLRGVAGDNVCTGDIYLGVIPFVLIQLVVVFLLLFFPAMATELPALIFK